MKAETIAENWAEYERFTLGALYPIERMACRKAFFAGCLAMLRMQQHLAISDATDTEAIEQLKDWLEEAAFEKKAVTLPYAST